MRPTPFVKWAGGKTRLLSQYEPYFPVTIGRYIEPFVGGGAVFFHLHRQGRLADKPVFLIDRLEELMNCYQVIQNQVEALIAALGIHEPHKGDADYFYRVRGWDRSLDYGQRTDVERAARLIFLNHVCYNGLYRVNRRAEFNVPFGRYHNPTVCDIDNLRVVHRVLQGVSFLVDDFERCLELAEPDDFVYLDPPYHPLSDTAHFTSYTSDDFGLQDQQRLADVFRELDRRGCQVMLSNSCTDLVQNLYDGYQQINVQAARAINSKIGGRGKLTELLIVNRYECQGNV